MTGRPHPFGPTRRPCGSRISSKGVGSNSVFLSGMTLQIPGLLPGSTGSEALGLEHRSLPFHSPESTVESEHHCPESLGDQGSPLMGKIYILAEPGEALVRAHSLQAESPSCPLPLLHPRSPMVLGATEAFHLLVNNRSVASPSVTMAEIYRDCKDKDGFVCMTCSSQEVFGGLGSAAPSWGQTLPSSPVCVDTVLGWLHQSRQPPPVCGGWSRQGRLSDGRQPPREASCALNLTEKMWWLSAIL